MEASFNEYDAEKGEYVDDVEKENIDENIDRISQLSEGTPRSRSGKGEDVSVKLEETEEDPLDEKYKLYFPIHTSPPFYINFVLAFQQTISNLGGPISTIYMLQAAICAEDNPLVFAELLSTTLFMMGICTFLMVSVGVRLPIIQGSSYTFIPPVIAMMATAEWRCPPESCYITTNVTTTSMTTDVTVCEVDPWLSRLCEISGGLIAASFVQVVIGTTGMIGCLMRYIGPLTIIPTITLIGLSMFESATGAAQHQWGIAFLVVALYYTFALVLRMIKCPLPSWNKAEGCHVTRFPVTQLLPTILSMGIGWLMCYIFTITDVFPDDPEHRNYYARTDVKNDVIDDAKWFYIPYPGQWGWPTFGVGIFFGLLAASISSIIESLGDYYACAKVCQQPPPPKHAMNRGIAVEGLGSMLCGLFGAGHATTSYSSSIGNIKVTGVASRAVYYTVSVIFMICGVFGKIGAALSIIPEPVIGGGMITGLGMLISVGLLPMQHLPMKSVRNMLILGTSIILGMMIPTYLLDDPDLINTGSDELDQVIMTLLSTAMCVGGFTGFILDNIIPGSKRERGIEAYLKHLGVSESDNTASAASAASASSAASSSSASSEDTDVPSVYDLPFCSDWLRHHLCCTYVPFLPSYIDRALCCKKRACCARCRKQKTDNSDTDYLEKDGDSDLGYVNYNEEISRL